MIYSSTPHLTWREDDTWWVINAHCKVRYTVIKLLFKKFECFKYESMPIVSTRHFWLWKKNGRRNSIDAINRVFKDNMVRQVDHLKYNVCVFSILIDCYTMYGVLNLNWLLHKVWSVLNLNWLLHKIWFSSPDDDLKIMGYIVFIVFE